MTHALKKNNAVKSSRCEELSSQTFQALPSHIAVIDRDGAIVSVNQAWTEFACGNAGSDAASVKVGANYLDVCRRASAANAEDADQALAGIESVLAGSSQQFNMEYACHSLAEKRWFLMTVTPLVSKGLAGAVISHLNITDRKQAEAALLESEQRIQQALRVSHSFTFEWLPATDQVRRSASCALILKLQGNDTCNDTGERFFMRVHPDDRARFVQILHDLTFDRPSYTTEYRVVRGDGDVAVLEETGEATFDSGGKLERLVGVSTDITARKQSEETLRFQARLLDAVGEAVVSTDIEQRITYWNRAASALFGWSSAEVLGRDLQEVTGLQQPPQGVTDFMDEFRRSGSKTYELQLRRRDGTPLPLLTTNAPVFDDQGRLTAIIGVGADLTERKRTEDVLRFLGQCGTSGGGECFFKDLARYLAQALAMDFVCIDRLEEGHLSARTLAVFHNGRFEDNVSYTLNDTPCGDVVGKRICVFPRNVRGLFEKDAVLQTLQAESYLGTTLWSAQGKPIGLIAVIGRQPLEDTRLAESILQLVAVRAAGELERLQAEHALTQLNTELEQRVRSRTAELAETNRELEAFCYSVSHDLRAPLRSMDGFSQALLDDYGQQLDDAGHDFLNRIRSNCQRMARLIDDLLQLSRLTQAQMRHQSVDLTALAQAIIAELRQTEPGRVVDVRIAPGMVVIGDPVLLRAALANLLQNAWKFTSLRPDAVIEVGRADGSQQSAVGSPSPASSPVFFVRDNGVGFDMQYADKLFTPFQRLHAMTEFPGSGIGLATVQRVINRHKGRIWFEAAPSQGTTFYFTIGAHG
jgi:PAS domain S-box-containing protein